MPIRVNALRPVPDIPPHGVKRFVSGRRKETVVSGINDERLVGGDPRACLPASDTFITVTGALTIDSGTSYTPPG